MSFQEPLDTTRQQASKEVRNSTDKNKAILAVYALLVLDIVEEKANQGNLTCEEILKTGRIKLGLFEKGLMR